MEFIQKMFKIYLLFKGVAAVNQFIYVVGGYDGKCQLNCVERYDTERDIWEFVTPMRISRSALSVTVLDCKLYAMGELKVFSILSVHKG